ncbi:MAG TPA: Uma2 family endonuclease [Verrucomicrobiota bacterium]|nr:Uma2 family endonuclease [Verrucomicrobiota bacterium]
MSVAEYLSGEEQSEVRHEYIGGSVYAMAGGSEEHCTITGNLFAALHAHLRGQRCRAFVADMKVRLVLRGEEVFYYPDVVVACDPRDTDRYFKRYPQVLIEVLSDSTERIDRREKRWSYLQMESLEEYVLVAQDYWEVTVYRRGHEWAPEILASPDSVLTLPSLEFSVPLSAIYEGLARV